MRAKLIVPLLAALLIFSGCTGTNGTTDQANKQDLSSKTTTMEKTENKAVTYQMSKPAAGDKVAAIETDLGTIKIKLFKDHTPEMTKNFETLANDGKYDGVPFHRVIADFMIQGGDFENMNGSGGYSYKGPGTMIDDEIVKDFKHHYGSLSMAHRGANTNGSQFFIVVNDYGTPHLDGLHSVFGHVYEGMDVAEKIVSESPNITNMNKVTVTTFSE